MDVVCNHVLIADQRVRQDGVRVDRYQALVNGVFLRRSMRDQKCEMNTQLLIRISMNESLNFGGGVVHSNPWSDPEIR